MNPPADIRGEDHRLDARTGRIWRHARSSDAWKPTRGLRRDIADRDRDCGKSSGDDGGAYNRPSLPPGQH